MNAQRLKSQHGKSQNIIGFKKSSLPSLKVRDGLEKYGRWNILFAPVGVQHFQHSLHGGRDKVFQVKLGKLVVFGGYLTGISVPKMNINIYSWIKLENYTKYVCITFQKFASSNAWPTFCTSTRLDLVDRLRRLPTFPIHISENIKYKNETRTI